MIDRVYLQPIVEKGAVDNKHPSCTIQVDLSPNCEVELSVKVITICCSYIPSGLSQ